MAEVVKQKISVADTLPFKIGAPSYVWPTGYSENVEKLREVFDEVQLLVLEPPERSPIDASEIETLKRLKREGFSYSVHLPVPGGAFAQYDGGMRALFETAEICRPLQAENYILHIEEGGFISRERAVEGIREIAKRAGVKPESVCVENLDETFDETWEIAKESDASICFDVGHLLKIGGDPFSFIDRYAGRIRMVHLHGVADGIDHRPLSALPMDFTLKLFQKLRDIQLPGAVIIENFSLGEIRESLEYLSGIAELGLFAKQMI